MYDRRYHVITMTMTFAGRFERFFLAVVNSCQMHHLVDGQFIKRAYCTVGPWPLKDPNPHKGGTKMLVVYFNRL